LFEGTGMATRKSTGTVLAGGLSLCHPYTAFSVFWHCWISAGWKCHFFQSLKVLFLPTLVGCKINACHKHRESSHVGSYCPLMEARWRDKHILCISLCDSVLHQLSSFINLKNTPVTDILYPSSSWSAFTTFSWRTSFYDVSLQLPPSALSSSKRMIIMSHFLAFILGNRSSGLLPILLSIHVFDTFWTHDTLRSLQCVIIFF